MLKERLTHDKIHICKECQFEVERNGHALTCFHYTYKSWKDFKLSEQKKILEESAKQGAEDQNKLLDEFKNKF